MLNPQCLLCLVFFLQICLFVSEEEKQNRALSVRNRMSQLFAAFHPFKVVEQSSQTLSLFVTLLQHLFRLVAAMDNVAKYLKLA